MNDYYGVDPATPCDLRDLSDLCRLFRPSEGRFLMGYPDDWGRRLRDHMDQLSDFDRLVAIERFITDLQPAIVPSPPRTRYDDRRGWSENAHSIRDSVYKLIGPPGCSANVEAFRTLLEARDGFPDAREALVPRTVNAYVNAAKPLFLTTTKVVLVDPYFRLRTETGAPDTRRRKVLKAFLEAADSGKVRVFKLVVSASKACLGDPSGDRYEKDFAQLANDATGGRIECELEVIDSVSDRASVSQHARYLLGLQSGLQFDWGFDLDDRSPNKSTNHVHWLTKPVLDPLLDRYA